MKVLGKLATLLPSTLALGIVIGAVGCTEQELVRTATVLDAMNQSMQGQYTGTSSGGGGVVLPGPGSYNYVNMASYLNSRCSEEKLRDGRYLFNCPSTYVVWDGRRASSSGSVTMTEFTAQGQPIRSCRSTSVIKCW